jgi:hypothetical protein
MHGKFLYSLKITVLYSRHLWPRCAACALSTVYTTLKVKLTLRNEGLHWGYTIFYLGASRT